MKKLLCFDLDGTLTQHRSKLEEENAKLLTKLQKRYKVIMIGAGGVKEFIIKFLDIKGKILYRFIIVFLYSEGVFPVMVLKDLPK